MFKFGGLAKKTSDGKSPSSSGNPGHAWRSAHPIQRKGGNQAILREFHERRGLTRLPRRSDNEQILGKAKDDALDGLKKNSTNYRPVLNNLDALNSFLDNTDLAPTPDGMEKQLDQALELLKKLEESITNYIEKKNNKKSKYMESVLLPALRSVRVEMIGNIVRYKTEPVAKPINWNMIATCPPTRRMSLTEDMLTGENEKGGVNTVQFFNLHNSDQVVFKETKNEIREVDEDDLGRWTGMKAISSSSMTTTGESCVQYRSPGDPPLPEPSAPGQTSVRPLHAGATGLFFIYCRKSLTNSKSYDDIILMMKIRDMAGG